MNTIRGVFVVAPTSTGFAATTRPVGGIGLPGGKVEPTDKSMVDALVREAKEEGWALINVNTTPFHRNLNTDGSYTVYFSAQGATKLSEYKEYRITKPEQS